MDDANPLVACLPIESDGEICETQPMCADETENQSELETSRAELRLVTAARGSEPASIHAVVEALLFASDAPLGAARLAELVGAGGVTEIRLCIAELNDRYIASGASFKIEAIARGYQMMTRAEFAPWLAKLYRKNSESRLSAASLETLSIIAYKQPITRADVEAVRGVACGDVINRLRDMNLVRTAGRAEVVGRPLLYATTRKFLDVFGLADLNDLPALETLKLRPAAAPAPLAAPAPVETEAPAAEIRAVAGA